MLFINIPTASPEPLLLTSICPPFNALILVSFVVSVVVTVFVLAPLDVKVIFPEFVAAISVPVIPEDESIALPTEVTATVLPESSEMIFNIPSPEAWTPFPELVFVIFISPPVSEWICTTSVVGYP